MPDKSDEIFALARGISERQGCSILEAMRIAEAKLSPANDDSAVFTVEIRCKPRQARWVRDVFGGHPTLSIEDRLGAFLSVKINAIMAESRAATRKYRRPDKGAGATTLPAAEIDTTGGRE